MPKNYLNKGISTPVGIFVIVLAAIIAGTGILAYQYWWTERIEEVTIWESFDQEISFIKGQFKIQLEKPSSLELKEIRSFAEYFENEKGGELIFTNENLTFYIGVPNFLLAPGGPEEFYAPCKSYCEEKGFPVDTPENDQCIRENYLLGTQEDISKGVFYIGIHERNPKVKEELQNTVSRIIDSIKIQELKDETVDWKTYTNRKYGYEIKYLSGLEVFEKEQGGYVEIGAVLVNFSIKIEENISFLEELKSSEEDKLITSAKDIGVGVSDLKISWTDKTFLGLPAKELNFKGFAGGEPMIWITYVIKDNNAYILSSGNSDSSKNYYQILSTFRFLEKEKPYIKILSPNRGEKLDIGETFDILWEAFGVEKVGIFLRDCSVSPCKSTAIAPFDTSALKGKYSWKITIYGPGDKYQIEIRDKESPEIKDQSDNYFSIVPSDNLVELEGKLVIKAEGTRSESWAIEAEKGPAEYVGETIGLCMIPAELKLFRGKQVSVSIEPRVTCFSLCCEKMGRILEWKPLEKSINVLSPNGGEEWELGKSYEINWQSTGIENVNIYLNFPDAGICQLVKVPASQQRYLVEIKEGAKCLDLPINNILGTGYKVIIKDAKEVSLPLKYDQEAPISDISDNYFTIIEK